MKITYILNVVADVTGVAVDHITSKSKVETVMMAKRLFIEKAKRIGYSTAAIAEILNISAQAVRNLIKCKETRKLYNIFSQDVEKIIATATEKS